jgi:hypothetical protein
MTLSVACCTELQLIFWFCLSMTKGNIQIVQYQQHSQTSLLMTKGLIKVTAELKTNPSAEVGILVSKNM